MIKDKVGINMIQLKPMDKWKKKTFTYENDYHQMYQDKGFECVQDGYTFQIFHMEEEYGADTWGWTAKIILNEGGTDINVAYKCISVQEAYKVLQTYLNQHDIQPATKGNLTKLLTMKNKYKTVQASYNKLNSVRIKDSRTSEFIGCPTCNSKIARTYLTSNYCPVCKHDLRSNTTVLRLQGYQKQMTELRVEIQKLDPTFYG